MSGSNTAITDRALAALRSGIASIETGAGETLALVYVSDLVDPNRRTLEGFRPGYAITAWRADQMHGWRLARLTDGTEVPFFPTFKAEADARYSIELTSEALGLFSIRPMPGGAANGH